MKLRTYSRMNGSCLVPDKYEVPCPNGGEPFKLGRWVARKRALYRDMTRKGLVLESSGGGGDLSDGGSDSCSDLGGLDAERIAALDALGFVWVVRKSPTPG